MVIEVDPSHRNESNKQHGLHSIPAAMLSVSKKVAVDAAQIFYNRNTFSFHFNEDHGLNLYPFANRSTARPSFRNICSLQIQIHFGVRIMMNGGYEDYYKGRELLAAGFWCPSFINGLELREHYIASLVLCLRETSALSKLHLILDNDTEPGPCYDAWEVKPLSGKAWQSVLQPLHVGLGLKEFQVDFVAEWPDEDWPIGPKNPLALEIENWLGPVVKGCQLESENMYEASRGMWIRKERFSSSVLCSSG